MKKLFADMTTLQKIYIGFFAGMMFIALNFHRSSLGGDGLNLPYNAATWIFATGMICVGLWKIGSQKKFFYDKSLIILGLCVVLLWIPFFYPNQELRDLSIGRLLAVTAGWLFIFTAYQLQIDKLWKHILKIFIISGTIYAISSLVIHYILLNNFFFLTHNTASGIFAQKNVASTFCVIVISALIYHISTQPKVNSALIFASIFLIAWVLFLNASRSGHISAFILIVFSFPYLAKKVDKNFLFYFYLAFLAGYITPIVINIITSLFTQEIPIPKTGTDTSIRLKIWAISSLLFAEKPILGWGYGAFESSFIYGNARFFEPKEMLSSSQYFSHPHNEVFLWIIEGGLLPLIAFLIFGLHALKKIFNHGLKTSLFFLSIIFPFIFHSLVEYPFYHSSIIWIIFLIFISRILIDDRLNYLSLKFNFLPQTLAIFLFLSTTFFMVISIDTTKKLVQFKASKFTDKIILSIISPISQLYAYSTMINYARVHYGLANQSETDLENFISWADYIEKRKPRPWIFYNHIKALSALNRPKEAKKIKEKAINLYPDYQLLNDLILE